MDGVVSVLMLEERGSRNPQGNMQKALASRRERERERERGCHYSKFSHIFMCSRHLTNQFSKLSIELQVIMEEKK